VRLSAPSGVKKGTNLSRPGLWPKTKIFYYVFSAGFLLLTAAGLGMMLVGKGPA
jgi:hypothetical protein